MRRNGYGCIRFFLLVSCLLPAGTAFALDSTATPTDPAGFSNEDDVFAVFNEAYTDTQGDSKHGFKWFIDGFNEGQEFFYFFFSQGIPFFFAYFWAVLP